MKKHISEKTLGELDYNELVELVAIEVHNGLLEEGGKGLKSKIHLWLGQAIIWSQEQKH